MSVTHAWRGSFGVDYLGRNRAERPLRRAFWRGIAELTGATSVVEFGCGAGWNLAHMSPVIIDNSWALRGTGLTVLGVEVNEAAAHEARAKGLNVSVSDVGTFVTSRRYDLAVTCGLLIHVPTSGLDRALDVLADASRRWVLAVEYEPADPSHAAEAVDYRGLSPGIWRRRYGDLLTARGLRLYATFRLGPEDGWDDPGATAWLLRWPYSPEAA